MGFAGSFFDLIVLKNIFNAEFEFAKTDNDKTVLALCY